MMQARLKALGGIAALAAAGFGHAEPAARPAPVAVRSAAVVAVPAGAMKDVSLHAAAGSFVSVRDASPVVAMASAEAKAQSRATDLPLGRSLVALGTVATEPEPEPSATAVPLPGALWLFASALLVFLGISARRSF